MTPSVSPNPVLPEQDILLQFFLRLESLFEKMDRGYAAGTEKYGFVCRGCDDNCCRTRFYHHTFIEYYYIRRGFDALSENRRRRILQKASVVDQVYGIADRRGLSAKEMCPLNRKGGCVLYSHRPMICRLHGIPHELHRPGKTVQHHPGCDTFYVQCGQPDYIRFDRTPFYMEMSALERQLRSALGISERIKMTIAQMLLT